MPRRHPISLLLAALAVSLSGSLAAAPRDDLLAQYATAAKAANPALAGLSAERGKAFHARAFTGGKPDTPNCTSCHNKDPRTPGRTPTGKAIEPVAVSAAPTRYSDPAKVEKWFKRNCNEVLGRECSAQEKGDWLSFMLSQ